MRKWALQLPLGLPEAVTKKKKKWWTLGLRLCLPQAGMSKVMVGP